MRDPSNVRDEYGVLVVPVDSKSANVPSVSKAMVAALDRAYRQAEREHRQSQPLEIKSIEC